MNTLVTMGAHTIRSQTLGVSVGNPLSLEPKLNVFNDDAFDTIDYAVYQAREHGLRIYAPLVDNYDYYHGGKFSFLRFRGIDVNATAEQPLNADVQKFYTDRTIVNDFKKYLKYLITHVNPYTGLSYAEDPTIFAYETGNELSGPTFGDEDVPVEWTDEICRYIKELAPYKLCIDGTYGINKTHLGIASVDAFDDHFYPLNITKLKSDIELVGSANKVYIAGEYGKAELWRINGTPANLGRLDWARPRCTISSIVVRCYRSASRHLQPRYCGRSVLVALHAQCP